ncbi:hypothetical protein Landi51_12209 [Colletotrichum acutatum]
MRKKSHGERNQTIDSASVTDAASFGFGLSLSSSSLRVDQSPGVHLPGTSSHSHSTPPTQLQPRHDDFHLPTAASHQCLIAGHSKKLHIRVTLIAMIRLGDSEKKCRDFLSLGRRPMNQDANPSRMAQPPHPDGDHDDQSRPGRHITLGTFMRLFRDPTYRRCYPRFLH